MFVGVRQRLVVPVLFLVAFVSYANNLMIAPLMKDIALRFGVEVSQVGFLITVYGLIVGGISLVAGPLSDHFGRRRTIIVCSLLACLTTVLFAASQSLTELYVLRILNALAAGPLLACAYAAVGDYVEPQRRGRAAGFVTSALFMSTIVGVPVALMLNQIEGLDWRAAFNGIGILALLACLGGALLPPPVRGPAAGRIDWVGLFKGYAAIVRDSRLAGMILVFLLIYVGNGIYITYYPSYLVLDRQLSDAGLAVVYLAGGICAYTSTHIAGRMADRANRLGMVTVASITLAISMAGILHVPTTASTIVWAAVCSAIVYMSSEAFRVTAIQTEAINIVSAERRGTFMGLISAAMAGGTSLGAAVGGMLLGRFHTPGDTTTPLVAGYDYATYLAIAFIAFSLIKLHRGSRAPAPAAMPEQA